MNFVHQTRYWYAKTLNQKLQKRKRGRPKGRPNCEPTLPMIAEQKKERLAELNMDDDNEEEKYENRGTKYRPQQQNHLLDRSPFSSQPENQPMFSYYAKNRGSVRILESSDISKAQYLSCFELLFPHVMKCELKKMFDTKDTVLDIIQKHTQQLQYATINIKTTNNDPHALLMISIANAAEDAYLDYQSKTCCICYETQEQRCSTCTKNCPQSKICHSCLKKYLERNFTFSYCINKKNCDGIYNWNDCGIHVLKQRKWKEIQYERNLSYKRNVLKIYNCFQCDKEFCDQDQSNIAHRNNTNVVICPTCYQQYCSTCGLIHDNKEFCALLVNDALTGLNKEDLEKYKPCPKCSMIIERNEGCLHMQCVRCQHHFCFSCGTYIFFLSDDYYFF